MLRKRCPVESWADTVVLTEEKLALPQLWVQAYFPFAHDVPLEEGRALFPALTFKVTHNL